MGKAIMPINTPNEYLYFSPADELWEMKMLPMTASVAMAAGVALQAETSGAAVTGNYRTMVAVENLNWDDTMGILIEPILATDDDYATAGKMKAARVPLSMDAISYFSVGAGTFTAADVGMTVELHSDFKSLAVDTAGMGATIVGYQSATRGTCKFNFARTEVA